MRKPQEETLGRYMASLYHGPVDVKALDAFLEKAFGREMKASDWPYDFSRQGIKTDISHLKLVPGRFVFFKMKTQDASGQALTKEIGRFFRLGDSCGANIYASSVRRNPDYTGPVRVAPLLQKAQKDFLKREKEHHGRDHRVTMEASSLKHKGMVGGYVWAMNGVDFSHEYKEKALPALRRKFQEFLKTQGITLSDKDMKAFQKPCHFAAFDAGGAQTCKGRPSPLQPSQAKSGYLDPQTRTVPIEEAERLSGKTEREHGPAGKRFLLNHSWNGEVRHTPQAEHVRYAEVYHGNRSRGAATARKMAEAELSPAYRAVLDKARRQVEKTSILTGTKERS